MKNILAISIGIIACFFVLSSCGIRSDILLKAQRTSDSIFEDISNGSSRFFSEKYFPKEQTATLFYQLRTNCDIANRQGLFINDVTGYDNEYGKTITDIYEYHLKCDDARFLLTYKVDKDNLELFSFRLESAKKENPLIKYPEKRIIKTNR